MSSRTGISRRWPTTHDVANATRFAARVVDQAKQKRGMAHADARASSAGFRPLRERRCLADHVAIVKPQIMFIAQVDSGGRTAWARIGRARFSKTGRTLYYGELELRGAGQPWYREAVTGEMFHAQPARADGLDRSEGRKRGSFPVEIDDDVREEYWTDIRREPQRRHERVIHS
jgi:hypothetical protein